MEIWTSDLGTRIGAKGEGFMLHTDTEEQFLPAAQVEAIYLNPASSVSSHALVLAASKQIPVYALNVHGEIICLCWSPAYGSISTMRRAQYIFSYINEGLEWAKGLIASRIRSQREYLGYLANRKPGKAERLHAAMENLDLLLQRITHMPQGRIAMHRENLLGIEGTASRIFFQALSLCTEGIWKFSQRNRRPATDLFNATLNYTLAILYGRVTHALIRAGLDPNAGVLHTDAYNRPVLTFDCMEMYRIWAEAFTMQVAGTDHIRQDMVETSTEGCRLSKEARGIIIGGFLDFMAEIKQRNGKRCSRSEHIRADMTDFAQYLLEHIHPEDHIRP